MSKARPSYTLKLHRGQKLVYKSKRRFKVVVAGRRWGKTQVSRISLIIAAASKPKQLVWYVAPTYQMARDLMWRAVKATIPKGWIVKTNESRMEIELINGSIIALKGADKPDSLRGVGLNLVIIDEAQDIKFETWEEVLMPTLTSTNGRAIIIGTPKAFNWLYDLFMLGQQPDILKDERGREIANEWQSWQFATRDSPFIPRREIEARKRDMDPRSFRQEFEASFESMSGRVYYPFDRKLHIGDYPFNEKLPIFIGMDFNVDPMSAIIVQEQSNGELWIVDEIVQYGSNTQDCSDEIVRRYWRHINRISIFPDPAGNNRNHDRGETSLEILRDAGLTKIYFKPKHPLVADRVNAVNRLLLSANGTVRLKVDRNCRKFIEGAEQTIYKPGSRDVDKTKGVEHVMDAFGYYADFRHPMIEIEILGVNV